MSELQCAINQGLTFLNECQGEWTRASSIWVEKVTYGSPILSETYCLAALNASSVPYRPWGARVQRLVSAPGTAVTKFTDFFSRLPLFSKESKSHIKAAVIEGCVFLPRLKRDGLKIFPRTGMAEDKYLEYIPITWTARNIDDALSNDTLLEMMIMSMLNYQADEFMEAVVGSLPVEHLSTVRTIIHQLCDPTVANPGRSVIDGMREKNGLSRVRDVDEPAIDVHASASTNHAIDGCYQRNDTLSDVKGVLSRFTSYVLTHPKVLQASASTYRLLRKELASLRLSHVTHCEDNCYSSSSSSSQQWIRKIQAKLPPSPPPTEPILTGSVQLRPTTPAARSRSSSSAVSSPETRPMRQEDEEEEEEAIVSRA